jgi:hypothetical protein
MICLVHAATLLTSVCNAGHVNLYHTFGVRSRLGKARLFLTFLLEWVSCGFPHRRHLVDTGDDGDEQPCVLLQMTDSRRELCDGNEVLLICKSCCNTFLSFCCYHCFACSLHRRKECLLLPDRCPHRPRKRWKQFSWPPKEFI